MTVLAFMLSIPLVFLSAFLIFKQPDLKQGEKLLLLINPLLISMMLLIVSKGLEYTAEKYYINEAKLILEKKSSELPEAESLKLFETAADFIKSGDTNYESLCKQLDNK